MKRIVSVFWVVAAVLMIFPALSAAQAITYPPTATPVVSATPAAARPVAVGPVATGGTTLAIQVSTATFLSPMDMYLAIMPFNVPSLPPDIFLFDTDTSLAPIISAAKWRTGVTSATVALLGNIPTAALPQGTYFLFLLVAPAGSLTNSILWQTSFIVGPPAVAPQADAYTWIGNTPLTVAAANGVLANDPIGSTVSASDAATIRGGTVTVNPDGSFVYRPAAGVRGTDSFTYTAAGAAATVTIQMDTVAWYVDNGAPAAGGDGRLASPFNTLAAAQNGSTIGDTIFVFSGTGSTGMDSGIVLKTDQKLLGQGLPFIFGGTTIVPAGVAPVIANTLAAAGAVTIVTLAGNNEVAGLQLSGAGATGNIIGFSGTAVAGLNIHDNVIDGLNREGVLLSNASGTGIIANNTFSNLTGAAGNAIDYITTAAAVSLGINGNTFSNVLETCIRVRFDAGGGTVNVTGNTLTTAVASNAGSRGIDVDASGTSIVSSTISGNTVGSAVSTPIDRSGIQVNATLSGTHRAAVLNNTVVNAGADGSGGIEAQAAVASAAVCLQLAGNSSAGGGPGYTLDNRALGTLQVEGDQATLEAGNTGTFSYLPAVANITFVPAGTCGF